MTVRCTFKTAAVAAVAGGLVASPVFAETFNFEDGTLQGWLSGGTGGNGSTSVELHNGSQMAYVEHTGDYTTSLSHDFNFVASEQVSLEMQAVAVPSLNTDAYAGVTVSFLNSFNIPIGSFSLYNITNPAMLGTNQYAVDNLQHNYAATMADFATEAGLNPSAPIAKISFSFTTFGQGYQNGCCGGYWQSTGQVWLDNVQIGAVPEPDGRALFLVGLSTLAMLSRRMRGGRLPQSAAMG